MSNVIKIKYPFALTYMNRKNLIIAAFFTLHISLIYSQDWPVPEDKALMVASFKFDDASRKNGEKVFLQNCISCHGTPGKNNFVKLVPPPEDPASEIFQKQTDGEIFFKITAGRGAMPSFKNVLTEEQRWSVISYLRSFNPKYVQPQPVVVTVGKYGGMDILVNITFDSLNNQFKTTVKGIKEKDTTAVAGIEVSLFVKRYFGQLQIDESKTTNNDGEAVFTNNKVLPGDTAGNIILYAQINAEGLSDLKNEKTLKAGSLMTAKGLISTRAMWTIASQAPIWLILAYSLVVIGVWSFLVYIVLQIAKIRKLGKPL